MRVFLPLVLVVCFFLPLFVPVASAAPPAEPYDDCDAQFIAFIGSSAYQFSPHHQGELGMVRLFTILSYQRAAHEGRSGHAVWQLRIDRAQDGTRALTVDGRSFIGREGATLAEFYWDGRDERGVLVPGGLYRYTFVARWIPMRRQRFEPVATSYDAAFVNEVDEAMASTDEVIVNYDLAEPVAQRLRLTTHATSCQIQQNAPMEPGFGYNFYYGSTHAHSNWSDGGHPTNACSSGNSYGGGTFAPTDVFDFARTSAGLDFWVVNEHNHLIQDALANNDPPVTEAKVRQRYQDGIAAANAASVDGSFVGIYGMEWGVSSNSDQGHVTLLETPKLFGWETCSTCNGPNPECTPGTNCYFDVFTPKRYGYLELYAASVANPSSAGALGIFNHPGSGNFESFAFDGNADEAIQGIAVRSGLAFSTASDCSTTNVGATDYSARWKQALNAGFHVAPAADHDSHCNNYGVALPTRTVYVAPSLTKADLLAAHKARHFFATEDPNAQLVFRTGDGTRIMGDIFNAAGGTTLVANAYDPDGEDVLTLEIWRGTIGGGVPSSPYASYSNQSQVVLTESLTSGTYWYYVRAVQADGHDMWSAPMWITFSSGGGGSDTIDPVASITSPSSGATVTGTAIVSATASDDTGVTKVEFLLDGALQSTDTTAPYEWSWNTTSASNASHTLVARAWDAAGNTGSFSVTVTVSNGGGGTPTSADVSGWKVTQANATYEYVLPAGTTIPGDGYLVIARSADRAAFESHWGTTLGPDTTFVNSGGAMPVLNGDEVYSLVNGTGAAVDGPSPAIAAGQNLQRADPCSSAWTALDDSAATPGSGGGAGCSGGVKLNEIGDASGTGNYIYEFIELHNDSGAASDTNPPSVSITTPTSGAIVSGTVTVSALAFDDVGVTSVDFLLDGVVQASDSTAPYEWSWNTTASSNGSYALSARAHDAATNSAVSAPISVSVNNDVTPPAVSIATPAAGSTVSGTVAITASASDASGIAEVEIWVDGALRTSDATSPYGWTWDTTTFANGSHSMYAKARDGVGNVATSATITVNVSNTSAYDVSGFTLTQASSAITYSLPAGTSVGSGGYVIVGRDATRAQFESHWGVTLGSNVVYINSAGSMPQINGSESYTLSNASGSRLDGATVKMGSSAGETLQRTKPCGSPNKASSWSRSSYTNATPGTGAAAPCSKGLYISEFADALGTGNYIYEYVELHYDN